MSSAGRRAEPRILFDRPARQSSPDQAFRYRSPTAWSPTEPISRLSDAYIPPSVFGTAALTTALTHGAGIKAVTGVIDRLDTEPATWLYDTSIMLQLAFRPTEALALQDAALATSSLFRIRREGQNDAPIRLLALMSPGDFMVNTPLDFITSYLPVQLDLLFIRPGQALPAVIPDHDVMFFAASEPDAAMLARLQGLFASWPRPVLNDPGILPALARDRLAGLLTNVPDLCCAPTVEVSRAECEDLLGGGRIGDLLLGCSYPVLVRPLGSHAGTGLEKIDSPASLAVYLQASAASSFFLTAFVDYRSKNGLYRKYRVAFIDRKPYLCHMALSKHWMVHYLNASMAESAWKRDAEAMAMAEFEAGFAARHQDAFAALHDRLSFDYYSIDCSELPDGRLLVFEADTAAIIHLMDPIDVFPYKHHYVKRVFDAFEDMLRSRITAAHSKSNRCRTWAYYPRSLDRKS